LYVRGNLTHNGTVQEQAAKANVLVGLAGRATEPANAYLNKAFRGVVVAPFGEVRLGASSSGHVGSFYGEKVECKHSPFHSAIVKHRPFDPEDLCSALSGPDQEACSPFCPCGPEIFVTCITPVTAERAIALFGYHNSTGAPVEIPLGDDNRLLPTPTVPGVVLPTVFAPGLEPRAFWVPIETGTLTWELRKESATATLASPHCSVDGAYPRPPEGPIARGESAGELPPSAPRPPPYTGPLAGDAGATALFDQLQANAFPNFEIRLTRFNCSATSSCADCDLPCGQFGYECQLVAPEYIDTFINGGNRVNRTILNGLNCPAEWPQGGIVSAPVDPLQTEVVVRVEARGIANADAEVIIDNRNGAPEEVCVVLPHVGDWCFEVEQVTGAPPPPTTTTRVCASWNAAYVDSDQGEDDRGITAGPGFKRYRASYARYSLEAIGPLGSESTGGYLDADGCTTAAPNALMFLPDAAPGEPGSLSLSLRLETHAVPPDSPGFYRPDDEFESDADVGAVGYSIDIEGSGVWSTRFQFGTDVPGSVPFETWTEDNGWALPPEQIQLTAPPEAHMSPVLNIAATVSTLLTTPDLGHATGHYAIVQGVGSTFSDKFGNPVYEASGSNSTDDRVKFPPPQAALKLVACTPSAPTCPDMAQSCIDLVTRDPCGDVDRCGCLPSLLEAAIPNTTCLEDVDCPGTEGCFHYGTDGLTRPCNGAAGCRCVTTCTTDNECQPGRSCFNAVSYGPCDGTGSCLCMKEDETHWKMIVTHEIGHQVQRRGIGERLGDVYQFDSGGIQINDPPWLATEASLCTCNHVEASNAWHCLQSIERTGAAQAEGFAQFLAARVWNDSTESDCTFAYYKEFKNESATLRPPVPINCATPYKWRNAYCGMGESADMGTELDWLGFLYSLNVLSPEATRVPMTDLWRIYRNACVPPGTPPNPTPPPCSDSIPLQWQLTAVPNDPPVACVIDADCSPAYPNCFALATGSMQPCPIGGMCVCKVVRQGFVEGTEGTFGAGSAKANNVEILGDRFGVSRDLTQ
jgi:hypothetical protein